MRVVRGRADVRWLPSRFHYALFKLIAYVVFSRSKPREQRGLVLAIDRDQTAAEHYLLSAAAFVVVAAFLGSLLGTRMSVAAAYALAIPAAAILLQATIVTTGLVVSPFRAIARRDAAMSINSGMVMGVVIASATLLATGSSPLRHIGTAFLVLVATNMIATIVVLLMERRFTELERRAGLEP